MLCDRKSVVHGIFSYCSLHNICTECQFQWIMHLLAIEL